jgi:membrane protease YdiL (CAAX protease family)
MMDALAAILEGRSFFEVALVAFALIVLPAMSAIYGREAARRPAKASLSGRYLRTMVRGWIVAAATIIAWRLSGRSLDALGLAWPPQGLAVFALAFSGLAILALLYAATAGFRPDEENLGRWKRQLDALRLAPRNLGEFAVFAPVAVTAGVWEEIFYRGFLIWFFAPIGGVAGAIVISALIFGAGHAYQGLPGVARTTFVGLIFGAGFALTGSLWWLIILHAAIDLFAGFVALRVYSAHRAQAARGGR